ncbi:MAG: hypothetical protein ABR974_13335 [Bacteroidales bacterium]
MQSCSLALSAVASFDLRSMAEEVAKAGSLVIKEIDHGVTQLVPIYRDKLW